MATKLRFRKMSFLFEAKIDSPHGRGFKVVPTHPCDPTTLFYVVGIGYRFPRIFSDQKEAKKYAQQIATGVCDCGMNAAADFGGYR